MTPYSFQIFPLHLMYCGHISLSLSLLLSLSIFLSFSLTHPFSFSLSLGVSFRGIVVRSSSKSYWVTHTGSMELGRVRISNPSSPKFCKLTPTDTPYNLNTLLSSYTDGVGSFINTKVWRKKDLLKRKRRNQWNLCPFKTEVLSMGTWCQDQWYYYKVVYHTFSWQLSLP